ncbi:MAG: WD40 repeat domain-containing protein [archaeon]|nr:WD40 repeat domain-containing protein [archaeon]
MDIDKENSNACSNMIINNALIDSLIPDEIDPTLIEGKMDSNQSLFQIRNKKRILSFHKKSSNGVLVPSQQVLRQNLRRRSSKNLIENVKEIYESNINMYQGLMETESLNLTERKISLEPERILDAPQLIDDYYLNLLDWGSQNILSVCLGNCVYLWNANNLQTSLLTKTNEDSNICSVSFMNNGTCLAIGKEEGLTEIWDIEHSNKIRTLQGHNERVSCLSWNNFTLTTGSKDTQILNHDVRTKDSLISKLINGHNKEVCSVKWSNEYPIIASGGNDNRVCIWDIRKSETGRNLQSIWNLIENNTTSNIKEITPLYVFNQHEAAVKALAWSPYSSNLLATGGGKKDHTIKFWNIENGSLISSYNTGSQVCNLIWNKYEKELISSHGYSKNQISVWKYPKMTKVADLVGHLNRVLFLAMSPDGCTLVSGSADETLRFWNINDKEKIKENENNAGQLTDFMQYMNIR